MIKFFRKIRYDLMKKNKTGKYFKYAIGEIILVVIGILIALSINNWNEKRKDKNSALEYHQRLIEDLERVNERSENIADRAFQTMTAIIESVEILESTHEITSKEQETLDYALVWYARFNYQMPDLSTLEEMKSNGDLGLIYNVELRKDIVDFNEYLLNLESIFNTLGNTIQNNNFIDELIRINVDTITLAVRHEYNLEELRNDPVFINSFSRMANHWRGSTYFMENTTKRSEALTKRIKEEIDQTEW